MTIDEKMAYARTHVESIARHDDEPHSVRAKALAELKRHIDAELAEAKARSAAPPAPKKKAKRG